ncbi:MAG: hypothetical protein JXR86_11960 [Spirochaetales bacterium]|nr:hypothetical protein [Spirochaetales bacterium]
MEVLDLSQEHKKTVMAPGAILLMQGSDNQAVCILHSGLAEILYRGEAGSPDLRVGLIKGESPFGIIGVMNRNETSRITIRTVTECIVSSRPMREEELISKIQSDFSFNFKVLRTLVSRIESTIYLFNNYRYLWHKYASIADSLALGCEYPEISGYNVVIRHDSTLEEYAGYVKRLVTEAEFPHPEAWSYNLFLGKMQDQLGLYGDQDKIRLEDLIDYQQFLFVKRILRKSDAVLKALFQKDEPSNQYIFEFLGKVLETMMKTNMGLASIIDNLINILFSEEGWVMKLLKEQNRDDPKIRSFLHYLAKFTWRCRKDTESLLGKNLFKEYDVFRHLKPFHDLDLSLEDAEQKQPEMKMDRGNRLDKYKGLLPRILDFAELPQGEREEFLALMEKFRNSKDRLSGDKEMAELRKKISDRYWRIYETCFLKIIDSDLKGFIPGIMLHFGVIDERLLSQRDLAVIDVFYSGNLYVDDSVPVMTLPYFLEKIYRSEREPSLTDMGDSFRTQLKKQEKMTEGQKEKIHIYENTAEDRVRFEIRKIAREMGGILFGNKSKAVPFLCTETIAGDLKRTLIEPEKLVSLVDKIRERDFSLFFREVMFKHELGADFIEQEVPPLFVLYPLAGTRGLVWQELDGSRKDTPGRFFFPLSFGEKLYDTLIYQLASFRWEIQKTIAGHNWTDPVEGGMVGAYYDYIQFYRKNTAMTPEAKKRLEEFIKKTRSDKDRFARDYMTWIDYEFEGKVRLNGAAREIFYRFCPFPAAVREQFASKPLYTTLDNRFNKRRKDDILKLKTRFIKYEKKNKVVPLELQGFMMYLEE